MLKVVSNTTPIITLLSISKLEILRDIYERIIIPTEVFKEIEKGKNKSFYTNLSKLDWIDIISILNIDSLKQYQSLDRGESEVIVLANEIKADLVIIDEKLGRKFAESSNLKVTGTLGILLKAKELGIINHLEPILELMAKNGRWLNKKLVKKILEISNSY